MGVWMNKKNWAIALFIVLLVSPLFANFAAAQATSAQPGVIESVLLTFVQNFGFLLDPHNANMVLYTKVLFALIVILPIFYLLSFVFKGKSKAIPGIISFAIGMISIMAIPPSTIANLTATYSGIATVILYILPIAAIFAIYNFIDKTVEEKSKVGAIIAKIVVCAVGFYYTINARTVLSQAADFNKVLGTTWINWVLFIFAALLFFAAMALFGLGKNNSWNPTNWGSRGDGGNGKPPKGGLGIPGIGNPIQPTGGNAPPATEPEKKNIAKALGDFLDAQQKLSTSLRELNAIGSQEPAHMAELQKWLQKFSESIGPLKAVCVATKNYALLASAASAEEMMHLENMKKNRDDALVEVQTILNKITEQFTAIDNLENEKIVNITNEKENTANIINDINQLAAYFSKIRESLSRKEADYNRLRQQLIDLGPTKEGTPEKNIVQKEFDELVKILEPVKEAKEEADILVTQIIQLKQNFNIIDVEITKKIAGIENFKNELNNEVLKRLRTATGLLSPEAEAEKFDSAGKEIKTAEGKVPELEKTIEKNNTDVIEIMAQLNAVSIQLNNIGMEIQKILANPTLR